jgi:phosphate transport system protein
MRATFHAELDELITDLATMTRLVTQMMTTASTALHHTDPTLADLVIAHGDQMTTMHDNTQQRCVTLLTLQAPVAGDLRVVVTALHTVDHLRRMSALARHIAKITRLKHPNPILANEVRPVIARMGLLASHLAADAATAIEHRDPLCGDQLAAADNEVDALHGHLLGVLFAPNWPHGVQPAVDTALIGRYYERFADHTVAIARQICYLTTGQTPKTNT